MVWINNCLFSLLAVGICAYTYHVPLSLWFNSGVEHGSLSYICKILFNTWYIFHTSVIDAGLEHIHKGWHIRLWAVKCYRQASFAGTTGSGLVFPFQCGVPGKWRCLPCSTWTPRGGFYLLMSSEISSCVCFPLFHSLSVIACLWRNVLDSSHVATWLRRGGFVLPC